MTSTEWPWALDRQSTDSRFRVIPVLLPGAKPVNSFLSLNSWIDLRKQDDPIALESLIRAARGEPLGEDFKGEVAEALAYVQPYRGLRSFREEDAPFFFGRENFTRLLVNELSRRAVIAVVGASGSGKSSVVQAGLIPALRKGEDGRVWEVASMTPCFHPLQELAACLVALLDQGLGNSELDSPWPLGSPWPPKLLAKGFAEGDIRLRTIVDRVLARQPGTDRLLLIVDQWEELYTLCRSKDERERFIAELLDAANASQLSIVITLRAEFFDQVLAHRQLSDALQHGVVNIAPMSREELRAAIEKPAQKIGVKLESDLVEQLLQDVTNEACSLPQLQFLLTQLWETRAAGLMSLSDYHAAGGVWSAMAEFADRAFGALSSEEQVAARRVLVQLVQPGSGRGDVRRQLALDDLRSLDRQIVNKLVTGRLLLIRQYEEGEGTVELAYEALIHHWPRLKRWVDEDREYLQLLTRLQLDASRWLQEERPKDLLLSGRRVEEAKRMREHWSGLIDDSVVKYIEASFVNDLATQLELSRAHRRSTIAIMASVVLALVTSALVFFIYFS